MQKVKERKKNTQTTLAAAAAKASKESRKSVYLINVNHFLNERFSIVKFIDERQIDGYGGECHKPTEFLSI